MSIDDKIKPQAFYERLQSRFEDLKKLSVWTDCDWSNESYEHSIIMSEIAKEMIRWGDNNEWSKVRALLNEIETAFTTANNTIVAYIGTDFTVTILEGDNKLT